MTRTLAWVVIVVLAIGVIVVVAVTRPSEPEDNGPVACTLDAKLCPDGSYVGRVAPTCEFAACPGGSVTTPSVSLSGNMKLYAPQPNEQVTRPLVFVGEGRTFESAFSFRLLESGTERVIAEGHDMLNAPDIGQFGPFGAMLAYPQPSVRTPNAILEVFEYSAKDGSVVNNVRVPVLLSATEGTAVKVFFGNSKADPNAQDCSRVFSTYRVVPKTTAVARAALDQLLAGVKNYEASAGYFTSLPTGVRINSLTIQSGTARVDFSSELNSTGGSCRVTAIRAQIENTLKQFPTVTNVVISVNGNVEEALQP